MDFSAERPNISEERGRAHLTPWGSHRNISREEMSSADQAGFPEGELPGELLEKSDLHSGF